MAKKTTRKSQVTAAVRRSSGTKTAAKKTAARKTAAKKTAGARKKAAAKPARTMSRAKATPLRRAKATLLRRAKPAARAAAIADVGGAEGRRDLGGVRLEAGRAGAGRVKRMIYPPGYKWSTDTKPLVGTDYCMHAHVGFLVQGRIDVIYPDGCVEVYEAPHIVAVAPGHDGHVVGSESAVLIEFDFEGDTINRFGMPDAHRHD
jgi:hypothetical protein